MYDRVIRLRGSVAFEPASKVSLGYELDPDYNKGFSLVIRTYLVAEDYSVDEFTAMVESESQKQAETKRFRTVFNIDLQDIESKTEQTLQSKEPTDPSLVDTSENIK